MRGYNATRRPKLVSPPVVRLVLYAIKRTPLAVIKSQTDDDDDFEDGGKAVNPFRGNHSRVGWGKGKARNSKKL